MKSGRFTEPRVTTYPYVQNRLVIIDWASLSYHLMHSMNSKSAKKMLGMMDAENELLRWRNLMFQRIVDYIALFNPRHLIFALEGKHAWRKNFVKEYYEKHTDVYVDKKAYYVLSDNYAYSVRLKSTTADGHKNFDVMPLSQKKLGFLEGPEIIGHRKLGELPQEKQKMLWDISTESGKPIIPAYKGQRKHKEWPFQVDKKYWMDYKDTFAKAIAPVFRARAIFVDNAEGDDICYAAAMKYHSSCDDVILVTRDSDMSQIDLPNLRIFNHVDSTFTVCKYPREFLDAKVLYGDTTDNISGMAFVDEKTGKYKPNKSNQLGEPTALTLLSNCPAVYDTACKNGWGDQYMRNRTLIDLSMVPPDVKEVIAEAISVPEPEMPDFRALDGWGISDHRISEVKGLNSFGFYMLTDKAIVDSNPGIFQADQYRKAAAAEDANDGIMLSELDDFDNISDFVGPDVSFAD